MRQLTIPELTPPMRIKPVLMKAAWLWAEESYCERNKVGAVLAKDGRIMATGYNGALSGQENICEDGDSTAAHIVHAEQNVLTFCAKNGIATEGCDIYVTLSPCITCAKLMIQAGISRVIYELPYRDSSGISLLEECGIEVVHV